jgi:hypothetical protein
LSKKRDRPWIPALVLCAAVAGVALTANLRTRIATANPKRFSLATLSPGKSMELKFGSRKLKIYVPADEGFTGGTFHITIPALNFASGSLERDGMLESAWFTDINNDAKKDAIFTVRCGGSGSFVEISTLETEKNGFRIRRLPPPPPVPGYMGHDTISIQHGIITRSFPTYSSGVKTRIDRQWQPKDVLKGRVPVKMKPDSNAAPSGATRRLRFNYILNAWEKF